MPETSDKSQVHTAPSEAGQTTYAGPVPLIWYDEHLFSQHPSLNTVNDGVETTIQLAGHDYTIKHYQHVEGKGPHAIVKWTSTDGTTSSRFETCTTGDAGGHFIRGHYSIGDDGPKLFSVTKHGDGTVESHDSPFNPSQSAKVVAKWMSEEGQAYKVEEEAEKTLKDHGSQ